ncbi:SEC14-like protein 2 [Folsomia candida]|nr:SEC14-like protein 2 [Folsomia candida]
MDNIQNEDWSQYEKNNPYHVDGVDKDGKPIMIYSLGEWDLRQASDEGRLKTLIRWVIKGTDEVHKITRDLFNQGKINGTQWTLIVNVDKFNAEQHLCAKCLTLFTDFATMYEKHFPGAAEEIILINALDSFDAALNVFRPLLSPPSRKALKVFGSNKEEWSAYLQAKIDPDQLPGSYGGTRKYD